ncbi:hypothetical protein IV102_24780 [bacterium]|nr:hypothetical protein [bacterium]
MDGLSEDADILFILTTNRVDLLESALASRPGRIDHAWCLERTSGSWCTERMNSGPYYVNFMLLATALLAH